MGFSRSPAASSPVAGVLRLRYVSRLKLVAAVVPIPDEPAKY